MRLRSALAALAVSAMSLYAAAPVLAKGAGEGTAGETNDKVVTFFCLGVLLVFVLIVFVGTFIQQALEKRKKERKAAKMRQRVGW